MGAIPAIPAIPATLAILAGGLLLFAAVRRVAGRRRQRARAAARAAEMARSAPRIAERLAAIRPAAVTPSLSARPSLPLTAPRAALGPVPLTAPRAAPRPVPLAPVPPPETRPARPRASTVRPPRRPSLRALVAAAGAFVLVLAIAVVVLVGMGDVRVGRGGVLGAVGAPPGAAQDPAARAASARAVAIATSTPPGTTAPGSFTPPAASGPDGFAADGASALPTGAVSAQAAGQPEVPLATGTQVRSVRGGPCGALGCRTYAVQSGDIIGRISGRFGVTIQAILAANPQVANPNLIVTHQVLLIPRP